MTKLPLPRISRDVSRRAFGLESYCSRLYLLDLKGRFVLKHLEYEGFINTAKNLPNFVKEKKKKAQSELSSLNCFG